MAVVKCAIELGIAEAIENHEGPMPLKYGNMLSVAVCEEVKHVGGDMFHSIPDVDAFIGRKYSRRNKTGFSVRHSKLRYSEWKVSRNLPKGSFDVPKLVKLKRILSQQIGVEEDFHCKQSRPPLAIRGSGILNHVSNVYTHKLFKLFEEEFKNAIGKFWFELSSMVVFMNLRLEEWMARGSILIIKNFDEIPNKYVLSRWCKNARNRWLEEGTHNASVDDKNDDYEIVYRNNMMRNAYRNVKAREIVQEGLKKIDKAIENELAKLSISLDGQEMENEVGDGQNVKETLDVNPILNPPRAKTKGVSDARFKGYLEKSKKKAKTKAKATITERTQNKLEIVKNGFLSFIDELCHLRQHSKNETSLASVCCLHGLIRAFVSIDNLIQLAKSGIHSPPSQEYRFSGEAKILEDGILKSSLVELKCTLNLFMKFVASEWHSVQSIETFGRGGPTPGVGIGWGASGGGFWSMTVLLAQTDARLLIGMLEIFQKLSHTEAPTDEEMEFTMHMITSLLGVFLSIGPRVKVVMEKALDILLDIPILKYLDFYTHRFLQSNERVDLFGWEYKEEDYVFFSNTLASHFKNRWLSVKRKSKATTEDNRTSQKGKSSLETIHEDLDISAMTRQDDYLTSLAAEWAHQRLPLPMHWFLSPVATISNNKQGCLQSVSDTWNLTKDPHDTLEVVKGGLFFLLGLEAMSTFLPTDSPSPVRCVPLIWKLHSLSAILLLGMGVLEDDKSRDVYEALQDIYGQLLDESRSIRNAEHVLEDNMNVLPEIGKKSTWEFLRFQSEIHESYSTFLETLVEQFAAISYGDILFGRQVAVYLHRCTEAPARLAAWNALANAHILEILPPLEKCFAGAEGYLEPAQDNEGILEAYVKAWVSGSLDRAATRGSMAYTLVLHHLSSFIFLIHASDKITLRNKLAKSLLRDYSKKQRHEGMMLELVRYYKPLTSHLPEKQEGLSLQVRDIEIRFEVLVEACDRDSSLLIEVEKLNPLFTEGGPSAVEGVSGRAPLSGIMRFLVHHNIFKEKASSQGTTVYVQTALSRRLLKKGEKSMADFLLFESSHVMLAPWHNLSSRVLTENISPFQGAHGDDLWKYASANPVHSKFIDDAMACDAKLCAIELGIAEAIENHEGLMPLKYGNMLYVGVCEEVKQVGGDMFHSILDVDVDKTQIRMEQRMEKIKAEILKLPGLEKQIDDMRTELNGSIVALFQKLNDTMGKEVSAEGSTLGELSFTKSAAETPESIKSGAEVILEKMVERKRQPRKLDLPTFGGEDPDS
ncbi:unnamed protein product [Dovyalis caffra]|uniref:RPAP1/MINIYO-like TPR repeats domain-containing protein n=1 Tax=Dovyalis caffra TaxID=77055 RepID=A0AAV1R9D8_9ROSI|nr:unnamed protein product [Dovyalis caffra]